MPSKGRLTRARAKMIAAAEAKGGTVIHLDYEPIRTGAEKEGPAGGWTLEAGFDIDDFPDRAHREWDHALGYNWREVLEWIEMFWPTPTGRAALEDDRD